MPTAHDLKEKTGIVGSSSTGSGSGGLSPLETAANVTLAITNKLYSMNTTAGVLTLTLPGGTTEAVVGVLDAAEKFGTNKVTVIPAAGQTIGTYAADDTMDLDYNNCSIIYYRASGSTTWRHSLQMTSNVPPATATTAGTIANAIPPTTLTAADLTSQSNIVIDQADIGLCRYSMANGTVLFTFLLNTVTITAGVVAISFTLPAAVPRPLAVTVGTFTLFDNNGSSFAVGQVAVNTAGNISFSKSAGATFVGGANTSYVQGQISWHTA